jgi:hypothetical protein
VEPGVKRAVEAFQVGSVCSQTASRRVNVENSLASLTGKFVAVVDTPKRRNAVKPVARVLPRTERP